MLTEVLWSKCSGGAGRVYNGSVLQSTFTCSQEIIKVREGIPHIGLLTKVIPIPARILLARYLNSGIDFLETT